MLWSALIWGPNLVIERFGGVIFMHFVGGDFNMVNKDEAVKIVGLAYCHRDAFSLPNETNFARVLKSSTVVKKSGSSWKSFDSRTRNPWPEE